MTKKEFKEEIVCELMQLLRGGQITASTPNKDVVCRLTKEVDDDDELYTLGSAERRLLHNVLNSDDAYMQYEGDSTWERMSNIF